MHHGRGGSDRRAVIATQFAFAGRAFLDTDPVRITDAYQEVASVLPEPAPLPQPGKELEIEYVRLFLNPAGAPCPPWQSAHEEEGRLMGAAHASALDWYARYGASPRAKSEPADHVGLLLMFYAQLLAAGIPEEESRGFAERHLMWIPRFCDAVARESRHPFYRWLGMWVGGLITK